ncbi:hypothetical protein NUU61_005349 [Penicillium alfredii]|uniref:Uncharacterized protein n=1 Tax=Penicillium alfredii TaxID=1506179 RepID=A0A9W9F9C8_9EURO|nr:uncharacterized protein NUU61_005349 [Penicillium alfredii]KAJ5095993.1 hypothetical protein NUU61_005349 [Penicillium alfredii]
MPSKTPNLFSHKNFRVVDPNNMPERPAPQPQRQPPRAAQGQPDIRQTKQYKVAARRWTSMMVGLPVLMYTSYMLYERVYGEKSPRRLGEREQRQEPSS